MVPSTMYTKWMSMSWWYMHFRLVYKPIYTHSRHICLSNSWWLCTTRAPTHTYTHKNTRTHAPKRALFCLGPTEFQCCTRPVSPCTGFIMIMPNIVCRRTNFNFLFSTWAFCVRTYFGTVRCESDRHNEYYYFDINSAWVNSTLSDDLSLSIELQSADTDDSVVI